MPATPRLAACTLLAVSLLATGPAAAGDSAISTVHQTLSMPEVEGLLDAMMLTHEGVPAPADGPAWRIQLAGHDAVLFLADCLGSQCSTVQLWAGFTPSREVALEELNAWNRTHRFSRAYAREDGTVHLESDLDLSGGTPIEAVVEFLRTYRASLQTFTTTLTAE